MSLRSLSARYGGNNKQAISRAIRAELIGGADVMGGFGGTFATLKEAQSEARGEMARFSDAETARIREIWVWPYEITATDENEDDGISSMESCGPGVTVFAN